MSVKEFSSYLKNIEWPSKKETWDVTGILGNRKYRFDVRDLDSVQKYKTNTKADKLVFNLKDKWVIVDTEELHEHIKNNRITYFELDYLLSKLVWNIVLAKKQYPFP
jgi:hypothetical protein